MEPHHLIRIADAALNERIVTVEQDKPSGKQILDAANLEPADDYVVLAIMQNGDFEDVRLAEPFDLRHHNAQRFIAFPADRLFRFIVDGRQLAWGEPRIQGRLLKKLIGISEHERDIWQEIPGSPPLLIGDHDAVDLGKPGVEHLFTKARPITIIINGRRKTVEAIELSFEEIVALAFDNPPTGDGVQFTVQFTRGPEEKPSGALVEGQTVKIKNGMEFDVTPTNRS